ncbi:MAG: prephenate dehydrogenase [Sporichthyaceae bacterium]
MNAVPDRDRPSAELRSALVVGTGLMGTSVALALRARGVEVYLVDRDPEVAALAAALGGGVVRTGAEEPADIGILAVPPAIVGRVLAEFQAAGAARAWTDLASIKGNVQRDVEALADPSSFVGGHPLAGRERSGPGAARIDLFAGRRWVLTPSALSSEAALAAALAVVELCDAIAELMDPRTHDGAVALVSHAPQVAASLVAARLVGADPVATGLAGQGIRDVTRIAASDPGLWTEILTGNAPAVADVLEAVTNDLGTVIGALRRYADGDLDAAAVVTAAIAAGNLGRAALPGKHGGSPQPVTAVPVLVPDKPGELGRLLNDVGAANINIEDMRIDHSPGQPAGLAELSVRPAVAELLVAELRSRGWAVYQP